MTAQTQLQPAQNTLLRRALIADAGYELALGVLSLLAAQPIAAFMGVDSALISAFGVLGLASAAFISYLIAAPNRTLTWLLVEVNALAAVLLIGLAISNILPLTDAGKLVAWFVAADFGILAALQYAGMRREV